MNILEFHNTPNEDGYYLRAIAENGTHISVVALTFGRARILVGGDGENWYQDGY